VRRRDEDHAPLRQRPHGDGPPQPYGSPLDFDAEQWRLRLPKASIWKESAKTWATAQVLGKRIESLQDVALRPPRCALAAMVARGHGGMAPAMHLGFATAQGRGDLALSSFTGEASPARRARLTTRRARVRPLPGPQFPRSGAVGRRAGMGSPLQMHA